MTIILSSQADNYDIQPGDNAHQKQGHDRWLAGPGPQSHRARLGQTLRQTAAEITRLGLRVIRPQLVAGARDQVFTADPVIFFTRKDGHKIAITSSMNSSNRQMEVEAAGNVLRKEGYDIYHDPHFKREGTGDAVRDPNYGVWFMGYGPRTEKGAGQFLADLTGEPVFEIPLRSQDEPDAGAQKEGLKSQNTEGFHLDVMALPLPTNHLMCYYDGLSSTARQIFSLFYDTYPKSRMIKIGEHDFKKFANNSFWLPDPNSENGYCLFIPDDLSPELKNRLSSLGYTLNEFDIDVLRWSGGGLHCTHNMEQKVGEGPKVKLNYVMEHVLHKWEPGIGFNREITLSERQGDYIPVNVLPGVRAYRPDPKHNHKPVLAQPLVQA